MEKKRIAATIPIPPGVGATLEHAVWAEERGFDDVWFSDSAGADALTLAGGVGQATRRVRIGTAIIPVFTRTPAVFASTALALDYLCGGRFILGLGSSSHTMMEGWNGVDFVRPLARVKETATLVRQMLGGEKTAFDGETLRSHGYRQEPLAPGRVPIYVAALRSRMLELAGEVGDGVVVNLFPHRALGKMLEHVDAGARRAGAAAAEREIVCRHQVLVLERPGDAAERERARSLFRRSFAPYYATPVYNRFLAWCGYEDAAATIAAGWAERDRDKTTGALGDRLIEEIAIIGSREECQDRIRELAAAGIDTHIIACFSSDPADLRRTFGAFTADVFSF